MIRLNVGVKLWLAFFGTLTFTVLAMYLLLHSSLKRSFLDYTSQQAVQRLEILQEALVNIYREEGSFAQLQQDSARWMSMKSIIFSKNAPQKPGDPFSSHDTAQYYYHDFVSSIALFDSDKSLLIGVIKPHKSLSWIPLKQSEAVVGYIGFAKPDIVIRGADRRFMVHQLKFFGVLSVFVLLISIAVATFLTRRISSPIKILSRHTQALAAGDYQQRIMAASYDEIG